MNIDQENSSIKTKCRPIAFYLPQYHQVDENDLWWGKGFTEWTNVTKAKRLYKGHYQPRLPADLGFYNLTMPEARQAQAEIAKLHGIEGFCYWHYWFAGRRLLEKPFQQVLASKEPDFPFCLAWANESWTGIWYGAPDRSLLAQTYPGPEDHEAHFYTLLEAFKDSRYITVDGKPVFLIYKPRKLPEAEKVFKQWRELALKEGLKGLHIVAILESQEYPVWDPVEHGYDGFTLSSQSAILAVKEKSFFKRIWQVLKNRPKFQAFYRDTLNRPIRVHKYAEAVKHFLPDLSAVSNPSKEQYYPCVIPDWDNTARSGKEGLVLHGSTPELFGTHVGEAVEIVIERPDEHRLLFVKSWNEWAEGNYMEPDRKFGSAYLEALRDKVV
jgi:lipopolysaccharide biosynthesis protein